MLLIKKLRKIGNSIGILIGKKTMKKFGYKEGDLIEIRIKKKKKS